MKAGIFYETGKVGLEELEKPAAREDMVIVKVIRGGICGSDVYAYRDNDRLTCVIQKGEKGADGQFGHEIFGVIDSVGSKVEGVHVGDHVFVSSTTSRRGGLAEGLSGAFSEYMYVEDAKYGYNLEKWDDDVSPDHAVLMEPMCVGTHGKNLAKVTAEDHVVILGGGTIGLCALCAVLAAGCKNPVVVDRHDSHLNAVKEIGGTPFHSGRDGELSEFLMKHFGETKTFFGAPVSETDVYIDCAGSSELLDQVLHCVKDNVRISIIAGYGQPYPLDISFFNAMQVQMFGSRGFDQNDVNEAFHNINDGKSNVAPIVTHHFKLDDIVKAFKTADDRSSGAIKVVVDVAEL